MGNGWSKYVNESNVACASAGAAECLMLAYNERAEFAGISKLTERPLIGAMNSGFCASFESALNALIPHFGKIVSGAYVPYTVESLYTELDEEQITVNSSRFNRFPRLWFEQVIRVFNKLASFGKGYPTVIYSGGYARTISESGTSLENAVNNAIANASIYSEPRPPDLERNPWPMGHWTGVQNLGQWYSNCYVTAYSVRMFANSMLKNANFDIKIYVDLNSYEHLYWTYDFDPGNSGLSQGKQLLFDITVDSDNNGFFDLPVIPGEDLGNFPKYPIDRGATTSRLGYYLYFNAIMYSGNFKFIAGS